MATSKKPAAAKTSKNLPPQKTVQAGYSNASSYQIISAGVTRTDKV